MSTCTAPPAAIPLNRVYSAPQQLREEIHRLHQTSVVRSAAAAAGDHLAIFGLIALVLLTYRALPPTPAALISLLALIGIARFQRALECLVHEASHNNWDRRNRRRNDLIATALVALPTFSTVQQYRPAHFAHHQRLGASGDPDLERYVELDIEALGRSSAVLFGLGVARRLPRYFVDWWRVIGTSGGTVGKALAWHVLVVLPVALLVGPVGALAAWLLWLGAFVLILPVLRFVGEAGEHKFIDADNVFDATMINEGRVNRLLIYPHNDGYHLVHHLWPGVPHHKLRRLHRLLTREDPQGYARRIRRRTHVLEEPNPSPLLEAGNRQALPPVLR